MSESEIEVRTEETNSVAPVAEVPTFSPVPTGDLSELAKWAADAREIAKVASYLAVTSFVPDAYRERAAEVTAAILAGHEVGLQPMTALRSINIINGTPAMSAVAMRGLIQSHGHTVQVVEVSTTRAVVHGQRAGEDAVHESVWTIDRADAANLTGKPNWKKQPQAMLVARATAECCRLTASDVLLGIPYSAEELADLDEPTEGKPKAKKATKRRTAKRRPIPEPELVAEATEPVTTDEERSDQTGGTDE